MAFLVDTDVAIHLRDGHEALTARVEALGGPLFVSIVTRVELENGVYRDRRWSAVRRATLDTALSAITTLSFDTAELAAFREIVSAVGYSRPRTNDRMIAATALVHRLVLVTLNPTDFRDIPGLHLHDW